MCGGFLRCPCAPSAAVECGLLFCSLSDSTVAIRDVNLSVLSINSCRIIRTYLVIAICSINTHEYELSLVFCCRCLCILYMFVLACLLSSFLACSALVFPSFLFPFFSVALSHLVCVQYTHWTAQQQRRAKSLQLSHLSLSPLSRLPRSTSPLPLSACCPRPCPRLGSRCLPIWDQLWKMTPFSNAINKSSRLPSTGYLRAQIGEEAHPVVLRPWNSEKELKRDIIGHANQVWCWRW